jgi:hypothetical protein
VELKAFLEAHPGEDVNLLESEQGWRALHSRSSHCQIHRLKHFLLLYAIDSLSNVRLILSQMSLSRAATIRCSCSSEYTG